MATKEKYQELADNIVAFDVSERLAITDVFLVATASNERQVSAVVDAVDEALHRVGVKSIRREGDREARWVLIDFGDLVVHVQHAEERELYSLERLWRESQGETLVSVERLRLEELA